VKRGAAALLMRHHLSRKCRSGGDGDVEHVKVDTRRGAAVARRRWLAILDALAQNAVHRDVQLPGYRQERILGGVKYCTKEINLMPPDYDNANIE
jgi:hypothetical protein